MFGGQKRGSSGEMVTITEDAWPSLLTLISVRHSEGEAARLKYESTFSQPPFDRPEEGIFYYFLKLGENSFNISGFSVEVIDILPQAVNTVGSCKLVTSS